MSTPVDRGSVDLHIGGVVREIARLGDGDDHVAELLDRLVRETVSCVDAADQCGIAVAFDGRTFTAAASDPSIEPINTEQFDTNGGPCLHAARTGRVTEADCTRVDERWPEFGAAAREIGVRSMLCAPIHVGEIPVGSLTLFSLDAELRAQNEGQVLDLLANAVGDALDRQRRRRTLEETIAGLHEAMNHRAPIEQAKGILMALRSIDADAAFAALSTESQRTNRKLRTVAAEFVHAVSVAASPSSAPVDAPSSQPDR
ncbi:GAF domain-containing protein [Rhodococcoides kroppenstedtii]|uniref:GAF domain-containing protein n=1 Tax=Rhodococcoides kroppenstedtii TaxID=293050 RepID=A0A1I0T1B9_9NOCA|nr:GAF and ANTAR domain-containing protein [Rhodococcus kroppenstedtii]SFA45565.1 GAF domain-containing protein [Rhodococcus kroppenstedtii]